MRKINSRSIHPVNNVTEYVVHIPGAMGDPGVHQTVTKIDHAEEQIDELLDKLTALRELQLNLKRDLHDYLFGKYTTKIMDDARSARAKSLNSAE